RRADALAVLHVPELANDVVGMAARDSGHIAQALQRAAVADAARYRLAVARARQVLAPGDAALRHVGDEAGHGIAVDNDLLVFRHFDDAIAQRLAAAVRMKKPLVALADVGFGHGVGLDQADPGPRLERSKIVGGVLDLSIGDDLGHRHHGGAEFAVA